MAGAAWIATGLLSGALVLPWIGARLFRREPREADVPEDLAPLPRPGAGAALMAAAFASFLLYGSLALAARGAEPLAHAGILLGANVVAAAAAAALLAKLAGADFDPARAAIQGGKGILAYVLLAPAVTALNALNSRLRPTGTPETPEVLQALVEGPTDLRFALLLATVVVAVPCFEEIFARGLLQQGVARELRALAGPRGANALAVIVASLVFAALHDPPAYVPVFALSLILGALCARTDGVMASIGFHAAHNAYAILFERFLKDWCAARGIV